MKRYTLILFLLVASMTTTFSQVNTDRVMMIGKNALYFEDYVLSIQYFNQAISAKPYLAEPYYFRAMAKFMLDDFQGAQEDASRCLERNPYYLAAYQLRGAAWQNLEEYELAATDYQRSLEYYPEDRLTLVNMGIVNIELEQYEVAEKFFEVLLRRHPDYTPGYLARSHMYVQMEDTTKALRDLDLAIQNDPYTAHSFSARGLLHFQQKEYTQALADLDEAIRLDPYQGGNYINRGLVKYHLNDLRGAMADYDRVIEMDENSLIARFNRGLLRAQVADNNRAIRDFDKVIELEPDNTIAYLNRAMLNREIGNLPGALQDLNVVLEEHPEFFSGYYTRSYIKREMNDLVGAERDYMLARAEESKARAIATENPEPLSSKSEGGEAKDTREETDRNIEKFNLLVVATDEDSERGQYQRQSRGRVQNLNVPVEREPRFVLTYYEQSHEVRRPVYYSEEVDRVNNTAGLNWVLKVTNHDAPLNELQVQAHFRSIDRYSERLDREDEKAGLFFGRGIDFMLVQDYENALKDMERALELDPNMTMAHFARAVIRTRQLEYQSTLSSEPVLSDNPLERDLSALTDLPGATRRTELSLEKIEYDAILREYNTVIRIAPDFIFAYYNRAEIFIIEKDYRAAIVDYTKAISLEPQFAEAYFNRGISRLSIGETREGLDDLRKAGELGIVQSYSIIKRMQ